MKLFQTECPLPPAGANFVSGPDTRSTLDILWACLSTLLLCTWTVQHPNVPVQATPRTRRQKLNRKIYMLTRKVGWMLVTLLAPEYIAARALGEFISAKVASRKMRQWAEKDGVEWTLAHAFFADMGGFAIRFLERPESEHIPASSHASISELPKDETADGSEGTIKDAVVLDVPVLSAPGGGITSKESKCPHCDTHLRRQLRGQLRHPLYGLDARSSAVSSYSKRLGHIDWRVNSKNRELIQEAASMVRREDIANRADFFLNLTLLQGDVWFPSAAQFLLARKMGIIDSLPILSADELKDQSKGDSLVKSLTLLQVTWLAIQLLVRAVERLPASQLEIGTLGFSICAFITYVFLFNKPQDVGTPRYHVATRAPSAHELIELAATGPEMTYDFPCGPWFITDTIPSSSVACSQKLVTISATIGAILFGSVHCIAWNFEFPTEAEMYLWRAAALASIVTPIIIVTMIARNLTIGVGCSLRHDCINISYLILFSLYTIARLCLIVEMFRSLFYLPPRAFLSTWTSDVPHIG